MSENHDDRGPEPAAHPGGSCPPIARLPAEMVDAIIAYLTAKDRVFLAQTCSWMRALAQKEGDLDEALGLDEGRDPQPPHLQRVRHFDVLAVLARDRPDRWVCDMCRALHPVHAGDTPAARVAIEKRDGPSASLLEDEYYGPRHADKREAWRPTWSILYSELPLRFCHVQLALKYTRLQAELEAEIAGTAETAETAGRAETAATPETTATADSRSSCSAPYQGYLRRLMAPVKTYTHVFLTTDRYKNSPADRYHLSYTPCSFYPKIVRPDAGANAAVGRPRPRFLVLSVYRRASLYCWPLTISDIGLLWLCPHQDVEDRRNSDGTPWWWERRVPSQRRHGQLEWSWSWDQDRRWCLYPASALSDVAEALYDALHGSKTKQAAAAADGICGACPRCPMDFAVRTWDGRRQLELRVWTDLGPEGSVADDAWQIHLTGVCPYRTAPVTDPWQAPMYELNQDGNGSMAVPHASGSVRALFESVPGVEVADRDRYLPTEGEARETSGLAGLASSVFCFPPV